MATYAYRSNTRSKAGNKPNSAASAPARVRKYRRRSTNEENQPYSIEAQDARLDPSIQSQPSWELDGHYGDDASGATLAREGLQHALRDATAACTTCSWSTGSTG